VTYDYGNLLSDYAPCYIMEDNLNFFKDFSSTTKIKPVEIGAFGPQMGNDVNLVTQTILHSAYEPKPPSKRKLKTYKKPPPKKPSIALLGGDFIGEHVQAIDTLLAFYDKIYLGSSLAIYFFMLQHKMEKVGDCQMDEIKKLSIEKLLQKAKENNKQVIVPNKFLIALKTPQVNADGVINEGRKIWPPDVPEVPDVKEEVKEETKPTGKNDKKDPKNTKKDDKKASEQNLKKQITPDVPLMQPEQVPNELDSNYYIYGYEQSYIDDILNQIPSSRNVLWIGSFNPTPANPENADTDRTISFVLYQRREDFKEVHLENGVHHDWLVSCAGQPVIDAMNTLDVVLDTHRSKKKEDELSSHEKSQSALSKAELEDGEAKSASAGGEVKPSVPNNAGYICDSVSTNVEFVLKMLSAEFVEGFEVVTQFDMKKEGEDEEEFSFLDEI